MAITGELNHHPQLDKKGKKQPFSINRYFTTTRIKEDYSARGIQKLQQIVNLLFGLDGP
jgi:hypothetical protein